VRCPEGCEIISNIAEKFSSVSAAMSWRRATVVAFVMAFGFPPVAWWPLSWLAFVILLYPVVRDLKDRNSIQVKKWAIYFSFYSLAVNVSGFYWLAYTLKEFGGLPWLAAVPVTLFIFTGFSVFTAVFFAALAWVLKRLREKTTLPILGPLNFKKELLILFVALCVWDFLDPRLFPWTPAMSVGSDAYLLSTVSLLGTGGWRFLYFSFSMIAILLLLKKSAAGLAWRYFQIPLLFGAVLTPVYLLGVWKNSELKKQFSARQPVALVQGNIGNYEKKLTKLGVMPTVRNVLAIHRTLVEKIALRNSPLYLSGAPETWVIWPETSYPGFPVPRGEMRSTLEEWTRLSRGLHLVGAYDRQLTPFAGKETELDFNITALFHETQGYVSHAKKMIRIPFGEYIPFDESFPNLYQLFPAVNHFGKGTEFTPLAHPDPTGPVFVPVVCYEILYADFVDDYVKAAKKQYPGRSIVIVNPTNDSWYGPTSEPFQHSLLARWSMARQALPGLRPTNTGLSQVIAPWGEVLSAGPQDESTVIFGELPVEKTQRRLLQDSNQEVYGN
jgi:apolipoprotein N-acyltransferase